MNLHDEIASYGRKLRVEDGVKEVDIIVKLENGSRILWNSYNEENKY